MIVITLLILTPSLSCYFCQKKDWSKPEKLLTNICCFSTKKKMSVFLSLPARLSLPFTLLLFLASVCFSVTWRWADTSFRLNTGTDRLLASSAYSEQATSHHFTFFTSKRPTVLQPIFIWTTSGYCLRRVKTVKFSFCVINLVPLANHTTSLLGLLLRHLLFLPLLLVFLLVFKAFIMARLCFADILYCVFRLRFVRDQLIFEASNVLVNRRQ